MAELLDPGHETTITPAVQAHALQAQTKENAHDKERKANPVGLPAGTVASSTLSAAQHAILGSVSGAAFTPKPKKEGEIGPSEVAAIGLDPSGMKRGQSIHPDLETHRPLGSVRNRQAVERGMQLMKGETTWDELHASEHPFDQPPKTTSYARKIAAGHPEAIASNEYNQLVRLHGEEGMQYRLPFGETGTAPMDNWMREAAMDTKYTGEKPGKPSSNVIAKATKGLLSPDLTADALTHAVIGEGLDQAQNAVGSTVDRGADQSVVWHQVRDANTLGHVQQGELPSADALNLFQREQARMRGEHPADKPKRDHISKTQFSDPGDNPDQGRLF
jgi:hypothetical protein